jgi:hypothetical protein
MDFLLNLADSQNEDAGPVLQQLRNFLLVLPAFFYFTVHLALRLILSS